MAILQQSIAKVRTDRLAGNNEEIGAGTGEQFYFVLDDLEKEFQRAIELYKQPNGEVNKNVLKVIDELATFYTKLGKYQVCQCAGCRI